MTVPLSLSCGYPLGAMLMAASLTLVLAFRPTTVARFERPATAAHRLEPPSQPAASAASCFPLISF